MSERGWQIGICGTFDVDNYGDLLFPLLADRELTDRLGSVTIHPFSYHAKTPATWPYPVTSVADLPLYLRRLDGLLIGGGFIIRFDKDIAPEYRPPRDDIHHPTGYWLSPALLALQHNVPVLWNAPGMHCNEVPAWGRSLVTTVAANSRYLAVRDELSRDVIARETGVSAQVVPDTAFGIQRLLSPACCPSADFLKARREAGLSGRYVVIQSALAEQPFAEFVARHQGAFDDVQFLALPIGPAMHESTGIIASALPNVARLKSWPRPLVLAELIARSEGVVGHSYHLFITALTSGVPIFTWQDLTAGKYSALDGMGAVHALPAASDLSPHWLLSRLGRRATAPELREQERAVAHHWDTVAKALQSGPSHTRQTLDRFWQTLPGMLEQAAGDAHTVSQLRAMVNDARQRTAEDDTRLAEGRRERDALQAELTAARAQINSARTAAQARDRELADLLNSRSWKLTAPARFVGRRMRAKHRET
jgi:lipopolysaccharide transport system ATP-binding protein